MIVTESEFVRITPVSVCNFMLLFHELFVLGSLVRPLFIMHC